MVPSCRYRTVRDATVADVGRALAMATGGALAFAPVELVLTTWSYAGPIESWPRFIVLVATLSLWLWLWLALGLVAIALVVRAYTCTFAPERATAAGWFAVGPLSDGVRTGVPRLWALVFTAGLCGLALQRGVVAADRIYKEPELRALVIVALALVLVLAAVPIRRVFAIAADIAARVLAPVLAAANPLGRWRAAGVVFSALAVGAAIAVWLVLPQSRSELEPRYGISALVIAVGAGAGAYMHERRPRRRPRRRRHAAMLASVCLVLTVGTLWKWGGDLGTKFIPKTASPPLQRLIDLVRFANDVDRDGYGSLLGENDCDPFDASIHPGAIDIPDDGIDQNCDGHDFTLHVAAPPSGPTLPMPPAFKKPWNVLLITIDATRYDHTTFGGYLDGPKHRDTTPRLAELVKKSVSFTFCNAPSAGTMASIPAIITSKYFHSGLALDEHVEPGMPPRLKPENTTLAMIMKRGGYYNGIIASHEYWNDWGMEQGVDEYDNSIGKTPDPYRIAADKSTDHALAWISRQQNKKWFLWVHYIDPHGRYMAHPDVADWGDAEPDKYDEEIKWTDQQVGRLFDEMATLPSTDHTIIIITSDHGDSMAEHNVPLGTHGTALYRELQHVPLIFYIPENQPRLIGGAVSNLDIVPTVAELAGIDVHDLSFEGRSEIPAIFYGKEDHDRIVFAETNAPTPQRAAISEHYKLIYYLQSNLYELYDLHADPWEHNNLAPKHPAAFDVMKTALDGWLERVVYARDATFNQANEHVRDVLLSAPETPQVATTGQTLDSDKLVVTGVSVAPGQRLAPGAKIDVHVYFEVKDTPDVTYKFQLSAWPVSLATWKPTDAIPPNVARSSMRATADGFFPSDHWRVGEHVRERFSLTLPNSWAGDGTAFALVASDAQSTKAHATGATPANDGNTIILGVLPVPGGQPATGSPGRGLP